MAFEIPTELIRDLRAALRRESGVPDDDPSDPPPPPLPSIPDAVAALDPSLPPYLRCHRCRGGLLRGLRSTFCVFCGAEQRGEASTHSISFKSTAACRRFLEALGLDGSESIALDSEESKSSKGRDSPKDGMVLSDLLDLEISWPSVKREPDNISTTKAPPQSSYALNLSGVDLDTFFTDTKNELASSASTTSGEQLISEKQIKKSVTHTSGSEDLGFFEIVRSSERGVSSTNKEGGEVGDSFTDWEADFQYASSESIVTDSKSDDPFQNFSTTDSAKPPRSVATIDQSIDKENAGSIKVDSEEPNNGKGQLYSTEIWTQDDLWGHIDKDAANTADQLKAIDHTSNDELKNNVNSTTSESKSLHQHDSCFTTGNVESNKTTTANDNDDSFDDWQDFTTSSNVLGGLSDSQTQADTGTTLYDNSLEVSNKTKRGNDDSFDEWRDFTSSVIAQEGQSDFQTQISMGTTSHEKSQETNPHDIDFGSFSYSDYSSGVQGGQKDLNEVHSMQVDVSGSDRINRLDEKIGVLATIPGSAGTGGNSNADENVDPPDPKVAMLMSQMHDLSFMLKDELSIPRKLESSDSNC